MFYLMTHSTHFILRLYGVGHMVKVHSDSERGNPLPPLHGPLFPISSKYYFIAQWVHHEVSIRQPIAPRENALTTELHLAHPRFNVHTAENSKQHQCISVVNEQRIL